MKAQFKYSFLTGLPLRGITFGVIATMMLLFGIFTSTVAPWESLNIVAVSLGGCAIVAMAVINTISDVAIVRRMFTAPGAYLYALIPTPRWKLLLSSVVTILVLDFVTMTVVIAGQVWLSLIMVGQHVTSVLDGFRAFVASPDFVYAIWGVLMLVAVYLFVTMIVLFCNTLEKSVLFRIRASGWLTALIAAACVYVFSLLQLVLAPFGHVQWRGGWFATITLDGWGMFAYALLMLVAAAALFIPTAKLMERKINI